MPVFPRSIYFNFANKDELLLELLDKKRVDTKAALEAVFLKHKGASQRFGAARNWYAEQWRSGPGPC
jgi:hypothetical protein